MNLYELNFEIERLVEELEPDAETGEILGDVETVCAQINALADEKTNILTGIAKAVLNARATAAMLKEEEQRLRAKRARIEEKEAVLMGVLNRECEGRKTDLGVAEVRYRATKRLEVKDEVEAVDWLYTNKHMDCYKVLDPVIDKKAVRALIETGAVVPGCEIVEGVSCSLK